MSEIRNLRSLRDACHEAVPVYDAGEGNEGGGWGGVGCSGREPMGRDSQLPAGAISVRREQRMLVADSLSARYAMSGTRIAYGVISLRARAMRCPVRA
eukprot:3090470-Rhodomonas_salina.1